MLRVIFLLFFASVYSKTIASDKKFINQIKEIEQIISSQYLRDVDYNKLSQDAIRGAISGLDEYSDFFDKEEYDTLMKNIGGEFGGIGIEIVRHHDGVKVMSVLSNSPAEKSGMKSGDIITQIDNVDLSNLSLLQVSRMLKGKIGTSVSLSLISKETNLYKILIIKRENMPIQSVKVAENGKIPIIKIRMFNEKTARDLQREIAILMKGKPIGFILDLRNNPGGLLNSAVEIADIFLPPNSLVTYIVNKNGKQENILTTSQDQVSQERYLRIPLVILVNEGSASASEILASALQDHNRSKIIGLQTYGKGVVQDIFDLQSMPGAAAKLTIAQYYTPNGKTIDKKGVYPDIYCDTKKCNIENLGRQLIRQSY